MAVAMNAMRYDAAALGNHEFNYGIETLRKFEKQCHFPLLGANALDAKTLRPAFQPYTVKRICVPGAPDIKVGILGLTNPGIALWDKDNVAGKMAFTGLVEQAKKYVPRMRALGCDVVFLTDHSGLDGSSSYGSELPYVENASNLVAQQVPGIDAILVGHTHTEVSSYTVKNEETGKDVILSEPYCWGMRLTVFDFELELVHGQWKVTSTKAQTLNSNAVAEDPEITELLKADHDLVVKYVNTPVGTCTADLSAAEACWKDVPVMDFIHQVQMASVASGLSTADAALPLISVAAPFSRTADIPAGSVTIRDVAGLYIYDNTLYGKKLTGAQLKDYLEYAAKYYHQVASGTKVDTATVTNANNFWDYMYDTAGRRRVRHRHRAGRGLPHQEPHLQGRGDRRRPGLRRRREQLPRQRRQRLPAHRRRRHRLQLHQRDPPADDRLRHVQGHPEPGRLRGHQLEAHAGRHAGVLTR